MGLQKDVQSDTKAATGPITSQHFADHAHSLLTSLQRIATATGEHALAHLLEPAKLECACIIARANGKPPDPT